LKARFSRYEAPDVHHAFALEEISSRAMMPNALHAK